MQIKSFFVLFLEKQLSGKNHNIIQKGGDNSLWQCNTRIRVTKEQAKSANKTCIQIYIQFPNKNMPHALT